MSSIFVNVTSVAANVRVAGVVVHDLGLCAGQVGVVKSQAGVLQEEHFSTPLQGELVLQTSPPRHEFIVVLEQFCQIRHFIMILRQIEQALASVVQRVNVFHFPVGKGVVIHLRAEIAHQTTPH